MSGPFMFPLPASVPVSQRFGSNPSNGNNPAGGHTGTDYAAPEGTPCYAAGDGVIELAGWVDETYQDNPYWLRGGIAVALNCGAGAPAFTYGHLSATHLEVGQRVSRGDLIGLTGNTGHSFGAHLHFEAIPDGYDLNSPTYGRVDPATFCSVYPAGGLAPASQTITPIQEDDMPSAEDIAAAVWNYDYDVKGRPAKPLWLLKSLDAILADTVAKTARATADAILNTPVYDVRTGGKVSLATCVSWQGQDHAAILAAVGAAAPAGVAPEDFAEKVSEAIGERLSGLSVTLTAAGSEPAA